MTIQLDKMLSSRARPDMSPRMNTLPLIEHPASRLGNQGDMKILGSDIIQHAGGLGRRANTFVNFDARDINPQLDARNLPPLDSRHKKHSRLLSWPLEFTSWPGEKQNFEEKKRDNKPEALALTIKEKLTAGFHGLKHMFKSHDPNGQGTVSREAMRHILLTQVGFIRGEDYYILLRYLKLDQRKYISFREFVSCFFNETEMLNQKRKQLLTIAHQKDLAEPLKDHSSGPFLNIDRPGYVTATYCAAVLKERATHKTLDPGKILPSICLEPDGRIVPPQLREAVAQLGMRLTGEEFNKLWDRFDTKGFGSLKTAEFLKSIGMPSSPRRERTLHSPSTTVDSNEGNKKDDRRERERIMKMVKDLARNMKTRPKIDSIVDSLHYKFETPYNSMNMAFKLFDFQGDQFISRIDFRRVLAVFGLHVSAIDLEYFLSRCVLRLVHGQINFREFLSKFQNRKQGGIVSRIVTNQFHVYGKSQPPTPGATYSAEELEAKLVEFFHGDFLRMLGAFRQSDKYNLGVIPQYEFKSIVERCLGRSLNSAQWNTLKNEVTIDEDGLIPYDEFLEKFSSAPGSWNLRDEGGYTVSKIQAMPTPEQVTRLREEKEDTEGRSLKEIESIVKQILNEDFNRVDTHYNKLDPKKTKRLSKEQLRAILYEIGLELTSVEMKRLWKSFDINEDGLFTWHKFIGKYMKSLQLNPEEVESEPHREVTAQSHKKSAPSIENHVIDEEINNLKARKVEVDKVIDALKVTKSKVNQTIKTPGGSKDLLIDKIKGDVINNWEHLKFIFRSLDMSGTACIQQADFKETMETFEFNLSETEMLDLCRRFDTYRDGRFHYMGFMQLFTGASGSSGASAQNGHQSSGNAVQDKNKTMIMKIRDKTPSVVVSPRERNRNFLQKITGAMRDKLLKQFKSLRRAFKKADADGNGCLDISEFKQVLRNCDIKFNDEDFFHIISHFDENLDNSISYDEFLNSLMAF